MTCDNDKCGKDTELKYQYKPVNSENSAEAGFFCSMACLKEHINQHINK